MQEFNKQRFLNNVYYLAKVRGQKIGLLETQVGVSTGYLSRMNKDDKNAKPNVELVMNIAHVLGVGMDSIVSVDYSGLSETEKLLLEFFEKISRDTTNEKIMWEKDKAECLNEQNSDGSFLVEHPLFELIYDVNTAGDFVAAGDKMFVYMSRFRKQNEIWKLGDGIRVQIGKAVWLYVMAVETGKKEDTRASSMEYEVYLCDGGEISPLCTTSAGDDNPMNSIVADVYRIAVESIGHICIYPQAKNTIRDYINNTSPGNIPHNAAGAFSAAADNSFAELPDGDDDLPF